MGIQRGRTIVDGGAVVVDLRELGLGEDDGEVVEPREHRDADHDRHAKERNVCPQHTILSALFQTTTDAGQCWMVPG